MTIQELYDWAKIKGIEECDLEICYLKCYRETTLERVCIPAELKRTFLCDDMVIRIGAIQDC